MLQDVGGWFLRVESYQHLFYNDQDLDPSKSSRIVQEHQEHFWMNLRALRKKFWEKILVRMGWGMADFWLV